MFVKRSTNLIYKGEGRRPMGTQYDERGRSTPNTLSVSRYNKEILPIKTRNFLLTLETFCNNCNVLTFISVGVFEISKYYSKVRILKYKRIKAAFKITFLITIPLKSEKCSICKKHLCTPPKIVITFPQSKVENLKL